MATAILEIIGGIVPDDVWTSIQSKLFKPDPLAVDDVLGGQEKVMALIERLDFRFQIREPMKLIYYWTKRMQEVIDDLNRKGRRLAGFRAYNELRDTMRSELTGIRYQTFLIYTAVMGNKPTLGMDGILLHWIDQAYKKLSDEENFTYFIRDFINELDADIAAAFALLHHGLELSFFVAIDSTDAQNLKSECTLRVTTIRDALFANYPHFLRTLKDNSYDGSETYLSTQNFQLLADPLEILGFIIGDFLVIYDFFCRELAVASSGTRRSCFFQPGPSNDIFGPVQLHVVWSSEDNTRVKFYNGLPDSVHVSKVFTNTPREDATDILFKLIPLKDDNAQDVGKLVPFQDGTAKAIGADDNNTMGHKFLFQTTNKSR